MNRDIKKVPAPLEVIESQLLSALDDKSKVAILVTREDLTLLIGALELSPSELGEPRKRMLAGLRQLRDAAFLNLNT